tara:strand:- start:44566 stop:45204 length:639 start_codon:yes stop_codon:yes gene_type:complete
MSDNSFKKARLDYNIGNIDFNNIIDPIKLFRRWFDEVYQIDNEEAVSMNLSTISSDNYPNSRIVLLRGLEDGFIFYSNYKSQKGREIEKNPKAHINFYWPSLERQVRIKGTINKTSAKVSDKYFLSRPLKSRIGAILSDQSTEIPLDKDLQKGLLVEINKNQNKEIERPNHWGGYYLKPSEIEFWQGKDARLHDRLLYEKKNNEWIPKRLSP